MDRDAHIVAKQFATRLKMDLEKHLVAMAQMATFFENSREVTEREFDRFAASTLRQTPLCLRISAVDESLRIRWVHPPEPNRSMVDFDVKSHPLGYAAIRRAAEERRPILSPPLNLIGGAQGFLLAAPIYRHAAFAGAMVCSFSTGDFFAALTLPEVEARYEARVEDAGQVLFVTGSPGPAEEGAAPATERFETGGRSWTVAIRPRDRVVNEILRSGRTEWWVLGGLLAAAAGLLAGYAAWHLSRTVTRFETQAIALQTTRARLDDAREQLVQAEKMTALGELVAGVAHEINNPLSSILGYAQLLMGQELAPEVRRRRLETVRSEAQRIATIVENLLTFARKQPPEKKYLGLNGVIEKTLELKAYHFKVNQIQAVTELDPDLPKTMLDFQQMQQVFLNLLNNAEQALVEAGHGGTVTLATRVQDGRIEARVADDGPGIPPAIHARVFEPFFTTKQEGKGTGLGLSLCYGIIQEHAGTIRAEAKNGRGATFVITLPIARVEASAESPRPASPAGSIRRLRILVIDDEHSVQDFLVDFLSLKGHDVDTASDVPEALRKITSNGHDVIISDMKMPQGTGRDIYLAAQKMDQRMARRIVFTTGDGASERVKLFLEQTGNVILPKPFNLDDIERAIAGALRN